MNASDQTFVRLSRLERIALCNDIHRFSLLLGREALRGDGETLAASPHAQVESSAWERLFLLADLWPRLEAALHSIAASPDSAAIPLPRSLPIQAVRGNPSTLGRLARNPTDHRVWIQTTQVGEGFDASARVLEERSTPTLQTSPNGIVADFLGSLAHETQALHRLALFCEEPTAISVAAELSQRLRHWRSQSPFLECVALPKSRVAPSAESLLRCSPAYRSLYTLLQTSRSGLHLDWSESTALRFPTLEAWHLYEIWCFLRVGIALRDLGWKPFEADAMQIVSSGMRLRLAHGKASRIRFRRSFPAETSLSPEATFDLLYQPLFASANRASTRPPTRFRSLSHVMQPDIALIRNDRLLLLDPKYRSYEDVGAEQEDIDKMHAYRDAIVRTDADTGQTVPAVDAAWCLFPGVPVSPNVRPESLRTYPIPTPEYPFGTAGVGAVQIRPGTANPELAMLLRTWLESES